MKRDYLRIVFLVERLLIETTVKRKGHFLWNYIFRRDLSIKGTYVTQDKYNKNLQNF